MIEFLYGPIFRVIGFFYRVYTANRARFERFKARAGVSMVIRTLTVMLVIGWLLVWILAPEEGRNRLTEEVLKTLGSTGALPEK